MLLAFAVGGCAAKVPLAVPAAPSLPMAKREFAVVSVDRPCRDVADRLASRLSELPGVVVRPDASTRLSLFACSTSWVDGTAGAEAGGLAIVAVTTTSDGAPRLVANLMGAGRATQRSRRAAEASILDDITRDLAEQVAPVTTLVHRRVYADPGVGSARQFHNLAVDAEASGRLADALWWATLAWERHPSPRRARYVAELDRRVSRAAPESPAPR